ncbi:MAG: hypothetical protein ABW221_08525 [Vicinamibacteria bacterium]
MKKNWTIAIVGVLLATGAQAMDVSVGPVVGGQLMDRTDFGSGHDGPLRVGRSALAGLEVALAIDDRLSVSLDAVAGPYRDDGYARAGRVVTDRRDVDHAVLFGAHLTWTGPRRVRPFVGGGLTVKAYDYADTRVWFPARTGHGLSFRTGVERTGRVPAGLEVRWVLLMDHPLRDGLSQVEMQVRASVRLRVSRRR